MTQLSFCFLDIIQHGNQTLQIAGEHPHESGDRSVDGADEFAKQFLFARQGGQVFHIVRVDILAFQDAAEDGNYLIFLGKVVPKKVAIPP
jgi:hypothetical protein